MRPAPDSGDWARKLLEIGEVNYQEDENADARAIRVENPQECIDGAEHANPEDALNYLIKHLNKMVPSGMPPHELRPKKGCIVMLLRNLDVTKGLCNGTRLIVDEYGQYVLECRFVIKQEKSRVAHNAHARMASVVFTVAIVNPALRKRECQTHVKRIKILMHCIPATPFYHTQQMWGWHVSKSLRHESMPNVSGERNRYDVREVRSNSTSAGNQGADITPTLSPLRYHSNNGSKQLQQHNGVDGNWRPADGDAPSNGTPAACSECKLLRQIAASGSYLALFPDIEPMIGTRPFYLRGPSVVQGCLQAENSQLSMDCEFEVQQLKSCIQTIFLVLSQNGVVGATSPVLGAIPPAPSLASVIAPPPPPAPTHGSTRKRPAPAAPQPECPVALRPIASCKVQL
ncbi:hypothetical protein TELCIR_07940 [Teladorsagia circumcincta]|uniref:DNA helicase Pif1-like 2B domain-containing protein n=1 Tax=Teladorsagia circumcincta TaxID=45464 RepID=A0A2G9UIZ8_TELCI|nr:hypothetical protein TELCIR_07940 [Teladorsagia circumcincta]